MLGEVGDSEALGVEGRYKHLQAHQVFELEVRHRGLAFAELLDEFVETVADPLPGQHAVFLHALSHAPWQKCLVTEGRKERVQSGKNKKRRDVY